MERVHTVAAWLEELVLNHGAIRNKSVDSASLNPRNNSVFEKNYLGAIRAILAFFLGKDLKYLGRKVRHQHLETGVLSNKKPYLQRVIRFDRR